MWKTKRVRQWRGWTSQAIKHWCAVLGNESVTSSTHHPCVSYCITGLLIVVLVFLVHTHTHTQLDMCLQADSALYRSFRIKGSIGPMRVQLVSEGAFQELRSHMIASCHTFIDTVQIQRVIRRKEDADFLLRKTVS